MKFLNESCYKNGRFPKYLSDITFVYVSLTIRPRLREVFRKLVAAALCSALAGGYGKEVMKCEHP